MWRRRKCRAGSETMMRWRIQSRADDAVAPRGKLGTGLEARAAADMAAPSWSIGSRLAAAEPSQPGNPLPRRPLLTFRCGRQKKLGNPSGRLGSKSHSKPSKKLTSMFFSFASNS